jgi:pimeloyl-ACP methyl ester carboxylesterase
MNKDIRPFKVEMAEADLTDMKARIRNTRWPDKETVDDDSQGVQLATMQKVARYWGEDYDWRPAEARLNSYPQFVTNIDGVDIHFIHARSKQDNALPVIVTHGWPGSVLEQIKVIDSLTTGEPAFHVIIPSLPGYGFSGKPKETGWDPQHIARAWIELMRRLGYKKFIAQGGDWGNAVTEQMALQQPPELIGIHTNMAATIPADIMKLLSSGAPKPEGLSGEESRAYDQLTYFNAHGLGYALEMQNRPQTLYALADSPIGLAAWMFDHDIRSYELIARVFDGGTEGLTKDDLLDNVTLYWLTNTAVSSARLYWESKLAFFDPKGVKVPVAVSAFPDELYQVPKKWAEKAYSSLLYYNRPDKVGHYAAWEQPELFSSELRAAFLPLSSKAV